MPLGRTGFSPALPIQPRVAPGAGGHQAVVAEAVRPRVPHGAGVVVVRPAGNEMSPFVRAYADLTVFRHRQIRLHADVVADLDPVRHDPLVAPDVVLAEGRLGPASRMDDEQ